MKTLRLILGDQLNYNHSWFKSVNDEVTYVLFELHQETNYVRHHIQKVLAFFAAMRQFAMHLESKGHKVIYCKIGNKENAQDLTVNLKNLITDNKFEAFEYIKPDEYRLDKQLCNIVSGLDINARPVDSEHFMTTRYEVRDFFKGKKTYLLESFYRYMRKKHNIMMDGDKPSGGKWNFDASNRKKWTGNDPIPRPKLFKNDCTEILEEIKTADIETIGKDGGGIINFPINRSQAQEMLDYFCVELLPLFGTYEDAMTEQSWSLFHSRLSFAMNVKMLHPLEIIHRAIDEWQRRPNTITMNQIEGFVRQIIGWREFMRGIYWAFMPEYEKMNYFEHSRPLPSYYWTGETKMNCVKNAVNNSLDNAYAHHIQRLMVTGNFALMAGIAPDEVDAWYLGIYADAIQWVEITNTRGMSQFADGGIIATKPYVCSANYINNMSDYCSNCKYDRTIKYGEGACPFNSLYWNFFDLHRSKFEGKVRIPFVYSNLDKMESTEREKIMAQAQYYLDNIENL